MGGLLERRLGENRPAIGVWVTLRSADITEVISHAGIDWLVIDLEHSDIGYSDISDHLRAVAGTDVSAIVRIPDLRRDSIQRALDLGADGIMLPMASDAEEVAAAMRFAFYPPIGARGVSPARVNRWGGYTDLAEDLARANESVFVIPMFETRRAAENLREMLSLPGLRAAFVGLADLSAQYGDLGGFGDSPSVKGVVDEVLSLAAERDVAIGAMATSPNDAREKARAGYRMIGIGSDMGFLAGGANSTAAAIRAALAEEASG